MPTNQPIVLLRERGGERYLPIWIGAAEATAIAYAQQGVVPPRPMTHDLLKNVIEELGHELVEVRIVALKDSIFHATLVFDGAVEHQGGMEDAVLERDDPDLDQLVPELLDDVLEQVMGHRPRRHDTLLGIRDRRGFGGPDPDGQVAFTAPLAQQDDRLVGRHLDANSQDVQFSHLLNGTRLARG